MGEEQMKLHPEIQRIIDLPQEERHRALGFVKLSEECDETGMPLYELFHLGSGILIVDLISIIEEMNTYIEKMERDHAEAISDLYQDVG